MKIMRHVIDWLKEENPGDEFDAGVHNWVGIVLTIIWLVIVPYYIASFAQ